MYFPIDENAARIAHNMNSFFPFKEGKATADYQAAVNAAAALAEKQKQRVDAMHHEKIDGLLDAYARRLAEWYNKGFAIDSRCPSVMVAGPANFPTRKKEKQNAAREAHWKSHDEIKGLLDKIQAIGTGGISSDDPDAMGKLKEKLAHLESGGGVGRMASNVSAEKRRLKARIADLEHRAANPLQGWAFDGGEVQANTDANRLQIFFDSKPDEALRAMLKKRGFRWAPSTKAWQRQLTSNAVRAAKEIAEVAA